MGSHPPDGGQDANDQNQNQNQSSPQPPSTGNNFLFVDASNQHGAAFSRNSRRDARSFVMQNARRQRPWSTSRRQDSRSTASRRSTSTAAAGPKPPPASKDKDAASREPSSARERPPGAQHIFALGSHNASQELTRTGAQGPVRCRKCRAHPSGRVDLCTACAARSSRRSMSMDTFSSGSTNPFQTFPIRLDGQGELLLAHCTSPPPPPSTDFRGANG